MKDATRARMETSTPTPSPYSGADSRLLEQLESAAEHLRPELVDLSRAIHGHSETAFEEFQSAQTLAELVKGHGADVQTGVYGRATALKSEIVGGTGRGRTVAILAEYDALPEIGHGCGHNVIAAIGTGAFLALKAVLDENGNAFDGRVVLLGTPGEEGHCGKEYMAREGAFENIDAAVMAHPYGYDLADQVWLGRRVLQVTFHGLSAHASAQPFMGRNALDAASLAYQGISALRQQILPVDRLHAVVNEGGQWPSVIPERATLHMYVRSKFPETLKDLSQRVEDVMRGAGLMTGCGVDLQWDPHPANLPVRTNRTLTQRWVAAQQRRGLQPLPLGVVDESVAASTDFGNVSLRVPGIHPLIDIAGPDSALHTREFAEAAASERAHDAVVNGAYGLAAAALDFLVDDELAAAVKEEFEAAGGRADVEHYFD